MSGALVEQEVPVESEELAVWLAQLAAALDVVSALVMARGNPDSGARQDY